MASSEFGGRPRVASEDKLDKIVPAVVTRSMRDDAQKLAHYHGVSLGAWGRKLVAAEIDREHRNGNLTKARKK